MEGSERTSWEIIRDSTTKMTKPGSVGHMRALNRATDLFMQLLPRLKDADASTDKWKAEPGLVEAMAARDQLRYLEIREPVEVKQATAPFIQ
jgi:hypothetical protein